VFSFGGIYSVFEDMKELCRRICPKELQAALEPSTIPHPQISGADDADGRDEEEEEEEEDEEEAE
jgi:hypothetical protein